MGEVPIPLPAGFTDDPKALAAMWIGLESGGRTVDEDEVRSVLRLFVDYHAIKKGLGERHLPGTWYDEARAWGRRQWAPNG